MAEERQGFLGRWARRKSDALQGRPLDEAGAVNPAAPVMAAGSADGVAAEGSTPVPAPAVAQGQPEPAPERALTLDDVKLLTQDADFKPFMARDVGPEVRNAAMKKLFADPHFNVMDGLDIYIDDYSISDPIPESMLRQMTGAKFLKLFEEEEGDAQAAEKQPGLAAEPRENANNPDPQSVAQSYENRDITPSGVSSLNYSSQTAPPTGAGTSQQDHADPHLRLQPDHAASAPEAGRGTQ